MMKTKKILLLLTAVLVAILTIYIANNTPEDNEPSYIEQVKAIEKISKEFKVYKATYGEYESIYNAYTELPNKNFREKVYFGRTVNGENIELTGDDLIDYTLEDLREMVAESIKNATEEEIEITMLRMISKFKFEISKVYDSYDEKAKFIYVKETQSYYDDEVSDYIILKLYIFTETGDGWKITEIRDNSFLSKEDYETIDLTTVHFAHHNRELLEYVERFEVDSDYLEFLKDADRVPK